MQTPSRIEVFVLRRKSITTELNIANRARPRMPPACPAVHYDSNYGRHGFRPRGTYLEWNIARSAEEWRARLAQYWLGRPLDDWTYTCRIDVRTQKSGGTGWTLTANRFVTFQKAQRQCVAFVRNGPAINGQQKWILGAAFCRESASPIPDSEAQFVADSIKVRL